MTSTGLPLASESSLEVFNVLYRLTFRNRMFASTRFSSQAHLPSAEANLLLMA